MRVRRRWAGKDARPGERLPISGEGSCLLTLIDQLPSDGVVVSRATLIAFMESVADQQSMPDDSWRDRLDDLLRGGVAPPPGSSPAP